MKQIVNSLGKFLAVAIAAALVLAFIATGMMPALQSFFSKAFVSETNYVEKGSLETAPTLTCASELVDVAVGEDVDLFEKITARSNSGADLSSQLTSDFIKPVNERRQVFVYKINADKTKSLEEDIDSSSPGNWVVFYLIKDGKESSFLKVPYTVS